MQNVKFAVSLILNYDMYEQLTIYTCCLYVP